MKKSAKHSNRREFLKFAGLTSIAATLPGMGAAMSAFPGNTSSEESSKFKLINFFSDGLFYTPDEYLETLMMVSQDKPIGRDFYSNGGATQELATEFAKITGKEKAIFLPTGTMANELAIKLLSGKKTKIVVPENSHIFRDEADAAFTVHNKRLVPAGKGLPYFDVEALKKTINYYKMGEVFKSDVGAVSVENPVRRAHGTAIPLETLNGITSFCQEEGYKTHLDGARLHIASAYTGVSVKEYTSGFDTVYISLYKYLNAAFGGVLCGPAEIIDQIPHLVKIYGGAAFQTWVSSAMALHYLETAEEDWRNAREAGIQLIEKLNTLPGIKITPLPEGTNISKLEIENTHNQELLREVLMESHNIGLRDPGADGSLQFYINASILRRPVDELFAAFEESLKGARK